MDAPLYPPATVFVQPTPVARELNTKDSSLADLMAIPAAWAIVVKEIPDVGLRVGNPMLKPHLGNFSFRSLTQFGLVKTEELDRIDPQLRALGEVR